MKAGDKRPLRPWLIAGTTSQRRSSSSFPTTEEKSQTSPSIWASHANLIHRGCFHPAACSGRGRKGVGGGLVLISVLLPQRSTVIIHPLNMFWIYLKKICFSYIIVMLCVLLRWDKNSHFQRNCCHWIVNQHLKTTLHLIIVAPCLGVFSLFVPAQILSVCQSVFYLPVFGQSFV